MKKGNSPENGIFDSLAIFFIILSILSFIFLHYIRDDFKEIKEISGYIGYGFLIISVVFLKKGIKFRD